MLSPGGNSSEQLLSVLSPAGLQLLPVYNQFQPWLTGHIQNEELTAENKQKQKKLNTKHKKLNNYSKIFQNIIDKYLNSIWKLLLQNVFEFSINSNVWEPPKMFYFFFNISPLSCAHYQNITEKKTSKEKLLPWQPSYLKKALVNLNIFYRQ